MECLGTQYNPSPEPSDSVAKMLIRWPIIKKSISSFISVKSIENKGDTILKTGKKEKGTGICKTSKEKNNPDFNSSTNIS